MAVTIWSVGRSRRAVQSSSQQARGDLAMDRKAFFLDPCPSRCVGIGDDVDRVATGLQ